MKTKTMKKLWFLAAWLLIGINAHAQSLVCNTRIGGNANDYAYISWATNAEGSIVISITGYNNDLKAAFRGNGMNMDGFTFKGEPLKNYFDRTYTDGSKTIILTPKNGVTPNTGDVITFSKDNGNATMEWYTAKTKPSGNSYAFEYTYGAGCPQLTTPVISSITTEGVINFDPIANAGAYLVYIYKDDLLFNTQIIENTGDVLDFKSYVDLATYTVKLQALASGETADQQSDVSAGMNWTPAKSTLGASRYCNAQIGNNENNYAYLTWITDNTGSVVITISGHNGNEASFRGGNGIDMSGCKIYGKPITDYFTKIYAGEGSKTITLTPKDDVTIDAGSVITFSGKQIEWYSAPGKGANSDQHVFEYEYGTVCGQLAVPVISGITEEGIITFDPIDNAGSYRAFVYKGDNEVYSQTVAPGDKINFVSYVSNTYTVKLQAFAAPGTDYSDSELSAAQNWTPAVTPLGQSKYCSELLGTSVDRYVYLSWRTNAEGDITITVSGYDGAEASFRGNSGMAVNGFTIYGSPITNYFDVIYDGDGSKTITLSPKEDATVEYGDIIKFSGQQIEWWASPGKDGNSNQYTFEYVYGTTCAQLATPVIANIDANNIITFDAIANASAYTVYVYRDAFRVHTQTISSGEKIDFIPNTTNYTYTVTLKALSADETYMDSELSAEYAWNLINDPIVLAKSVYCDFQIGTNEAQYVNLSWNTDSEGNIVISISGEEEDEVAFRSLGLNIDGFKVYGVALSKYFDKTFSEEAITLQPKDDNSIIPGDKITYTGYVEWTKGSQGPYGTYTFEYIYGSTCSDEKQPLEAPVITDIAKDGTITFNAVANADSYVAYVYDEDDDEIHTQTVTSGGKITSTSIGNYVYTVKLKALPVTESESYLESDFSAAYEWDLTIIPISINDVAESTVVCYPNPATHTLYFTVKVKEVSVYSLQGQLVFSAQNVEKIDVSGYAKGMYIVQVTDKDGNNITNTIEVR